MRRLHFHVINDTDRIENFVFFDKGADVLLKVLFKLIKVIVYTFDLFRVELLLVEVFLVLLLDKNVIETQF